MPAFRRRALSACSLVTLAAFGLLAAGESQAAANHDVQRRAAHGLGTIRHDRAAGPAECASAGNRVPG